MGMDAGGAQGGPSSDINVTPLVDICLVLLIIFMVMTPKTIPEISVRIPPEKQTTPTESPKPHLKLGLTKTGGILINGTGVSGKEVALSKMRTFLDGDVRKVVFIDFDDDANYGEAVALVSLAKEAGAQVVGLVTRKDKAVPESLAGL